MAKTIWINYLLIGLVFLLNFLGSPYLKSLTLIYTAFAFVAVFLLDLKTSIIIIISLCFLEGQARVVWNYHPFFRIAFDAVIAVTVLKNFSLKKDLKIGSVLPKPMLLFIVLHVLW